MGMMRKQATAEPPICGSGSYDLCPIALKRRSLGPTFCQDLRPIQNCGFLQPLVSGILREDSRFDSSETAVEEAGNKRVTLFM